MNTTDKSTVGSTPPKETLGCKLTRSEHLAQQTKTIQSRLKRLASAARYKQKNLQVIRKKQRDAWRKKHPNGVGRGRWRKPKVIINDSGQVFISAPEAAEVYGVDRNAIYIALQNPNRICAGHRWAYAKSGIPRQWNKPADLKNYNKKKRFHERRSIAAA